VDKRCLIVAYYFPPIGGAGVQRIVKLIKYLSREKWQFTVVTADENSRVQPTDESQLLELPDNLKVLRVPSLLPVGGKSRIMKLPVLQQAAYWKRWLAAWLSIPDMRKKWIEPASKVILRELELTTYDCIMLTIPPYSVGLLATELQKKTNVPVILDLRDPWSAHPYKIHPTRWHKQINREMEFGIMKSIHYGISAYAKLLDLYESEIPGFQRKNWKFIPNGFDEQDFVGLKPRQLDSDFLNIGYSGTIHSAINNPQILFKAIAKFNKKAGASGKKIFFHHVGKSQVDLKRIARKFGIDNQIQLWGYRSHREALQILSAMDAFLLLHDDQFEDSKYIVAGKVYEYLRLKKPILGLVPEQGEAAELIRNTDAGVVISPNNQEHIVQTLEQWAVKVPDFDFIDLEKFSREGQAQKFLEVFEHTVSESKRYR